MILLRIVVFSDHLKANFWNSQEPIIVYEVSWLSFDNVSLYHVHYVPCHIWRKSRSTGSISFEPEPGSKSRWSYSGSLQKYWVNIPFSNSNSNINTVAQLQYQGLRNHLLLFSRICQWRSLIMHIFSKSLQRHFCRFFFINLQTIIPGSRYFLLIKKESMIIKG